MPKLNSLEDLLAEEIKDLYSAETQLIQALPNLAKAASYTEFVNAFEVHLEETRIHVERMQIVAELLGLTSQARKHSALKGPVEGEEKMIGQKADDRIKDLALVTAA
jgi:ferritin-like metal-binding protein YciE